MPERTTVSRIDEHRAIVAPATTGAGLMSASRDKRRFTLRHVIGRITGQTTSITDLRVEGRAGGGITDCDVALPVHVDAGHPAKQPVGSVVPILLLCRRRGNCVTGHVELVPAHSRRPGQSVIGSEQDRLIGVNGFGTTAVLVDQWIHDLVTQGVQPLIGGSGPIGTQVARAGVECVFKAVDCDDAIRRMPSSNTKGGIGRCRKIDVKTADKDLGLDCPCHRRAVHIHEPLRLTCRRRIACAKAGGNQAVLIAQVGRQN